MLKLNIKKFDNIPSGTIFINPNLFKNYVWHNKGQPKIMFNKKNKIWKLKKIINTPDKSKKTIIYLDNKR